ncbi:hypothetical protein FBQ81_04065 [Chloroflexi bacterium CFX6]|nr:hypothetical protein [Chloroflexi bacterium CFX6]
MKIVPLTIISVFALLGLALVLPAAAQWEALQIQAGLGNTQPLTEAIVKMAGGIVCLAIAWFGLKKTRSQ